MNIQIYATKVEVDLETTQVDLHGVDISDVIGEFVPEDVLDTLDFSDVHDYVIEKLKDDE